MNVIVENDIELIAIDYLQRLGYTYLQGPDISIDGEHPERSYNEVILTTRLTDAIDKLNPREYAFYTALEINNSAVSILGNETLRTIAKDLLESVRNNTTIDWTIKESVQATLRRNIRRILRKYGYPPDLQEKAVDTVIK